jgi:multicomponent Na+:H+ antiporter subunit B
MTERHDSVILHFVVRVFMVPFIVMFGAYVFIHGEISPGGGFQAGAIVASAFVLARLTLGTDHSSPSFPTRTLIWLASFGIGIYVVAGMIPMFYGDNFLDYNSLPTAWFNDVAVHHRTARAMGIFIVEVGVFIGVFSVLLTMYDYLTLRFRDGDDD